MLKENLRIATSVKEFDSVTEGEKSRLNILCRLLDKITSDKPKSEHPHQISEWRKFCYAALPDDVSENVNVLTLNASDPIKTMFDTYISMIRDRTSTIETVRSNLIAAYAHLTPYAFFQTAEQKIIETPLGEKISLSSPAHDKITLFPILRAALPAALSTGAALRNFGCTYEYITARIARPESANSADLAYFVDEQLFYMPPESVKDANVYIIDPLIAAGGSIITAHQLIKPLSPKKVSVLSLCATAYGLIQIVRNLREQGTELQIYTTDIGCLDNQGLVRPGYGDMGDRVHGDEERGKIRSLDELIGTYRPSELLAFQPEIDGIFKAAKRITPIQLKAKPILSLGDTDDLYDSGPEFW